MELRLINFKADIIDMLNLVKFTVSDKVFNYPYNSSLVHQVVSSYLMNSRKGTKAQKNRSEVSGSNRKPWRQKGTGRARSGSVKSPIWRSGGVTFAASSDKKYNNKINKKMYQGATKSILSRLACDNRLFLTENLCIEQPKTKFLLEKLKKIKLEKNVLIFTGVLDKNLVLAARNLYKVKICNFIFINPVSLINFDFVLIAYEVIKNIEQRLL